MNEIDSYIATIDELVEDENKIVTYKSLSHQLALPVNQAKEVLKHYLTNSESGKICAMYALTGHVNGAIKCSIVNGDKLESAKSKLDSVISCHVYSVQKANLKDPSPLYSVDYELTKTLLYKYASFGMIKYNGSKELSDEEIISLRSLTIAKSPSPIKSHSTKSINNQVEKKPQKSQQPSFFAPKPSTKVTKSDQTIEKNAENIQENGNSSAITNISESINSKEASKSVTKPAQKRKGMDIFMTKGKTNLFESHRPVSKTTKVDEITGSKPKPIEQSNGLNDISLNEAELTELAEKMETEDHLEKIEEKIEVETVEKMKEKFQLEKPTKSRRSLSRKSKSSITNKPAPKKRKRIKEVISSSSSESEEEFDNLDVIPPSPPPAHPKIDTALKNPRKKRVLTSKTYLDEDGSMLTEKVFEEVSCSSSDEENDKKTVKEMESPADPKPTFKKAVFKGKQVSITGFFTKKT